MRFFAGADELEEANRVAFAIEAIGPAGIQVTLDDYFIIVHFLHPTVDESGRSLTNHAEGRRAFTAPSSRSVTFGEPGPFPPARVQGQHRYPKQGSKDIDLTYQTCAPKIPFANLSIFAIESLAKPSLIPLTIRRMSLVIKSNLSQYSSPPMASRAIARL